MFNYLADKENYIEFNDNNYLDSYINIEGVKANPDADKFLPIPSHHWFCIQKIKVYVNGLVETVGGRFYKHDTPEISKHVAEYTNGSTTIEFVENSTDPILRWKGVVSNGDIINYESSKTLREDVCYLTTGTNFDTYDKAPAVNKWLARSWIDGGEEELLFLVESKQMIDDVAAYYSLPVPYDNGLATILTNDLQSTRLKSMDLNHAGEGNWVPVVVASIVFVDNVATKFRFYKTSRWNN